ncbi:MAG: response regulator [Candidatus Methanofastidiosia archaeon]|jgi:PAS domain S-box-containing protein
MGTLLVVDDDTALLKMLESILTDAGHQVTTASSGKKALEILNKTRVDLALIDLKLKKVSGFDLIKAIKENDPETVVIILTGFASIDSAITALRMGAYDYLQKPVKPELLLRTVERGLEKKELKELSEAMIKKMDEGVALLDSEGLIDFTSLRFCELSQYAAEEIAGRSFLSFVSPEYEGAVKENLKKAWEGVPARFQVSVIRKDGKELIAIISFTRVGTRILTVISDITEIVGVPLIRKELMYRIEPGIVYLVTEETSETAMDAFVDLIHAGYGGVLVTREHPDEIKHSWDADVPIFWLTNDVAGESTIFPNVALIERRLQPYLSRKRVVLIDRLDYVISKNSFESVLNLVQKLRDLAFMKKSIVLLSVDPRTLTEREFSLLEKETHPLEPVRTMNLSEGLLELLYYVSQRNEVGAKPFHKEIEKRFDITRTTVRKRLNQLNEKGLVVEKKKGRMKVVEITDKGKKMIR